MFVTQKCGPLLYNISSCSPLLNNSYFLSLLFVCLLVDSSKDSLCSYFLVQLTFGSSSWPNRGGMGKGKEQIIHSPKYRLTAFTQKLHRSGCGVSKPNFTCLSLMAFSAVMPVISNNPQLKIWCGMSPPTTEDNWLAWRMFDNQYD